MALNFKNTNDFGPNPDKPVVITDRSDKYDYQYKGGSWAWSYKGKNEFNNKLDDSRQERYSKTYADRITPKESKPVQQNRPFEWGEKQAGIKKLADGRPNRLSGVQGIVPKKIADVAYDLVDSAGSDGGLWYEVKTRASNLLGLGGDEFATSEEDRNMEIEGYGMRDETPISERSADDVFWRKYLDMVYDDKVIQESKYKPSNSIDGDAKYYSLNNEYLNRQDIVDGYKKLEIGESEVIIPDDLGYTYNEGDEEMTETGRTFFNKNEDRTDLRPILDPLQNFTIGRGKDKEGDYISMYDKYDLASNPIEGWVGKPFEIYDRIYFDSKTGLVNQRNKIKALENARK